MKRKVEEMQRRKRKRKISEITALYGDIRRKKQEYQPNPIFYQNEDDEPRADEEEWREGLLNKDYVEVEVSEMEEEKLMDVYEKEPHRREEIIILNYSSSTCLRKK